MFVADRHYSPKEVAVKLGVSHVTILRLLKSGELRSVRLGYSLIRVPEDALTEFVEQRTTQAERSG